MVEFDQHVFGILLSQKRNLSVVQSTRVYLSLRPLNFSTKQAKKG